MRPATKRTSVLKLTAFLMCLSIILTGFSGCKQPLGDEDTDKNAEHEAITILTGRQNYGDFVTLLNEKYPEVNLEFINYHGGDTSNYMLESLKHGDIPDIYTVTYTPNSSLQKEHLLDLANYSVINEYATPLIDGLNIDGGVYLLPSQYTLLGMVYNKTLMEEYGWAVPNSFEELKRLAPKIRAAGYGVADINAALSGNIFGSFFSLGNTVFFSTPEGAQWKTDFLEGKSTAVGSLESTAAYFSEWVDAGFISTYYYDHPDLNANSDFDNRKYVFQLYSNRLSSENTTDEFGFMPILSKDGSKNMLVRLVNRYYGLNKELGNEGNEQKLEDALKVLQLLSTPEGQSALSGNNPAFVSSNSINELPDDSPFTSVLDLIKSGNMIDMVYSGWEDHISLINDAYALEWINKKVSDDVFLSGMDNLNQELLSGKTAGKIAVADENISAEDTARLCAVAIGKATDADAAIISLPGFHGFSGNTNLENRSGVNCGIYKGDITKTTVNIFAPYKSNIVTVKMTGAEIKAFAKAGFTVEGDPEPYEFCLVTKGDMTLDDTTEYTFAVNVGEITDSALLERAEETGITSVSAVTEYLKELKSVTAKSITWK